MSRLVFEVIEGPDLGARYEFHSPAILPMGRSIRCGEYCIVSDTPVSRTHVQIEANPPDCRIRDLGSNNHTFVNGHQVTTAKLFDGDILQLGPTTKLLYSVEDLDLDKVYEGEDRFEPAQT